MVGSALMMLGSGSFYLAWPGAAVSLLAGLFCMHSLFQNRTPCCLDISPVGRIRVTVYQSMDSGGSAELMAGSTLWPGFLLLRLRGADGRTTTLLVWSGDVAEGAFRPLAVACRAIAARGTGFE
jgi:toxin CptA